MFCTAPQFLDLRLDLSASPVMPALSFSTPGVLDNRVFASRCILAKENQFFSLLAGRREVS